MYTNHTIDNFRLNFASQKTIVNENSDKYGIRIEPNDIESKKEIDLRVKAEIKSIIMLLKEYFQLHQNINKTFFERIASNIPIYGEFSPFQFNSYQKLCSTQIGQRLSYKELAILVNSRAFRAIGNIMHNNRFPILIPCHRVVSSDISTLGGFAGVKSSKIKAGDYFKLTKDTDFLHNDSIPSEIRLKLLLLKFEESIKGDI